MTPQLQQAIRLLQLSNLELASFVEEELERNPLLEREESGEAPVPAGGDDEEAAGWDENGQAGDGLDLAEPQGDAADALDTSLDAVFPDTAPSELAAGDGPALDSGWAAVRGGAQPAGDDNGLEGYVAAAVSLKDHLTGQLQLAISDPTGVLIGRYLVDHVDEAGYLTIEVGEVAERLGAPEELVEAVLATLQGFDPPGVLARNLGESLALQLKEQNRYDPQIARLLDNLHLLARHDIAALRRAVGVDMNELSEMIGEIKRLNPKPGLAFGAVQVQPVVPDVHVRVARDGSFIVELNSETLPRVLVNRSYYARVSRTTRSAREKDYLVDCLQTANWLVRSLDQRARTILRVAEEIVRQQDAFFTHGVQHLRPLNLKTVADVIRMHESTVSRVTSNKYMATPRGIFELKYFFTSAIAAAGSGEAHSSEAVRHRIRQLIEAETSQNVLSDDRIVAMLQEDGVDIARRTVAKYREVLRIPSSVQRRREKRLMERTQRAM
jgi:RNA polymerase sigma-54 factor